MPPVGEASSGPETRLLRQQSVYRLTRGVVLVHAARHSCTGGGGGGGGAYITNVFTIMAACTCK